MSNPRLAIIVQGGATASLDAQTNFDRYSMAMFSMFKFNGSTAWAQSLRSTYPGLQRILAYQIAAELRVNPGSVESGIYKGDADAHDAGLSGATNDYWVLRNNANWTLGTPSGAYNPSGGNGTTIDYIGNIGSVSFQNQWATNAIAKLQAAGVDGIFIDNVLGYLNGMVAFNPQTGVQYTDATWANAMIAFINNVVPKLITAGFYIVPNTYDGSTYAPGDVVWWDRVLQAGIESPMVEQWLVNGSVGRLDKNASTDFFSAWASQALTPVGRNRDFHVLAAMPNTDTTVRTYTYGTFLLRWDGNTNGKSRCWVGNVATDQGPWAATMVDPGTPAYRSEEVNGDGTPAAGALATSLYRRYYTTGIVYVNAHATNTYTITSYGDSRTYRDNTGAVKATGFTIAPGTAVILTADSPFVVPAPSANWVKVATANPGSSVAGMTKYGVALDNSLNVYDLIIVAVERDVTPQDTAGETVTDNLGNVYTQIPNVDWDSTGPQQITLYYSVVTKPGVPAIFANFPAASSFISLCAAAFRKQGYIPAFDAAITYGGSPQHQVLAGAGTDTITLSPTATQAGDLAVGAFVNTGNTSAIAAGTGYTVSAKDLSGYLLMLEHKIAGGAGAVAVTASPAAAMNVIGVAAVFKSSAIPQNRRELVPIQPGDWLAVNDYLAGIAIGAGLHRSTLPITAGDWQALNQYLADIPLGSALLRERLPLQPGNWESLNQYLALL